MKPIRTTCPKCNQEFDVENIIPDDDYIFCAACKKEFRISDFLEVSDDDLDPDRFDDPDRSIIRHYQPMGTWFRQKQGDIVFGATSYSILVGLFFILFCGIMFFFAALAVYNNGEGFELNNVIGALVLVSIGTIIILIASIFVIDKVEFGIGKDTYIKEQQGFFGKKKPFDWNSVEKIYEKTIKVSKKPETFIIIKLAEKTFKDHNNKKSNEISCGGAMPKNKRQFLLNTLLEYQNKKSS